MNPRNALYFVAAIAVTTATHAQESKIELKPGPGRDQVMGYCVMCHSVDYIQGNSPFMTRQVWEAEVNKMIKVYGAQVPPAEVPTIVDYLTANYGVATPANNASDSTARQVASSVYRLGLRAAATCLCQTSAS